MGNHRKFTITKDALAELLSARVTNIEIAKRWGVSCATVQNWINAYGLKRRLRFGQVEIPESELREMYVDRQMTQKAIAKHLGVSHNVVQRHLMKFNMALNREQLSERRIALNATKFALRTKSNGYWRVIARDHPRASREGYVFEHIIFAEGMIGRCITNEEQVHHMNLDKSDNSLDNLAVLPSLRDHARLHKYMERIGAYAFGLTPKRPEPIGFEKPAFIRGQWVREIDLIGDKQPILTRDTFSASAGKALVN